jgi:lysophospholipase L1-like esterase
VVRIITILAAFGCMLLAAPASAENRIEWRLENPFRLFKNPKDTALHREAFEALTASEQDEPILAAERKLEAHFKGRGWAETLVDDTCYDQTGNRYTACPDYILPKSHRVIATLVRQKWLWELFTESNADETCSWRLADTAGAILKEIHALCRQPVTLDVPYPQGGRLTVTATGGASAAADIKVRDVLIVGLGDSFGAGEGNPDDPVKFDDSRDFDYGEVEIAATGRTEQLSGYPARQGKWKSTESREFQRERARWLDRECHRSLYSHQLRAALQLAVENPKRAITFVGLACSGAEIPQGLLLPKPVRECRPGDNFASPAQLSQLSEELCRKVKRGTPMPAAVIDRMPELRRLSEDEMRVTRCEAGTGPDAGLKRPIDLIFLSIGGNDIGFTPIVSDSILSEKSIYRTLGRQTGAVYGVDVARKRADLVKQRFEGLRYALELFFQVRSSGAGQPPVLLTGYPHMGYGADGMNACGGAKGLEVFPPFQLDAAKIGKAEEFTDELNTSLKTIAGKGWTYVNGFRDDFRQHGLCAVNGEANENLGFPRRKDGVWAPFKPSAYMPYTPRQRWFRTPNDAFLAANMHADQISSFGANCSGLFTGAFKLLARKQWKPFQVFLASTYGGAFHPTAEGQARIADEVAAAARAALDRSN